MKRGYVMLLIPLGVVLVNVGFAMIGGNNGGPGQTVGGVLLGVGAIILYWAPTIIAVTRHVQGIGQVVVTNFFAFLFGIPWIIAMVMAFRHVPRKSGAATYGQIHRQPYGQVH